MLVIRQEQIDTLIKGTDEEFVEFLVGHVKEEFPEKAEDDDDETLRTEVRGGIDRAESHGFSRAEDVAAFVSIMFEIAPKFDEQAQIKAVLDDTRFEPEMRLEQLWSPAVTEDHWKEAEEPKSSGIADQQPAEQPETEKSAAERARERYETARKVTLGKVVGQP